jgi:hypothetical protein
MLDRPLGWLGWSLLIMLCGWSLLCGCGLLCGCSRSQQVLPRSGPALPRGAPQSIFPHQPWVRPGGVLTFRVTGQHLGPVTWRLSRNASGASLSANGLYTAGHVDGAIDEVSAQVGKGPPLSTYVQVGGALTLTPPLILVSPSQTVVFHVSGGNGQYRWSFISNAAAGHLDGQGVYQAAPPPQRDQRDIIEVDDTAGHSATAVVENGKT